MQQYISKSKTSSWDGPIDELAESILSPDRLQQSIIFYSALTALIIMMITITPVNDSNTILALENQEVHHGLVCDGWDRIIFRGDGLISIRAERMNLLYFF